MTMTNESEALRMLQILENPLVEIRCLRAGGPPKRGYFNDLELAADLASGMSSSCTGEALKGVYVTVNRLAEEFGTIADSTISFGKATKDKDIAQLRHLVLDIDPVRNHPDGGQAPSSEDEHDAALRIAARAMEIGDSLGWPEPLIVDSGNGAYAMWRVDLSNTRSNVELLRNAMRVFAVKLDTEQGKVDTCVGNPARIFRLAGTINRKGENSDERPHRSARIVSEPQDGQLGIVTSEQLNAFILTAGIATQEPPEDFDKLKHVEPAKHKEQVASVEDYLREFGISPSTTALG